MAVDGRACWPHQLCRVALVFPPLPPAGTYPRGNPAPYFYNATAWPPHVADIKFNSELLPLLGCPSAGQRALDGSAHACNPWVHSALACLLGILSWLCHCTSRVVQIEAGTVVVYSGHCYWLFAAICSPSLLCPLPDQSGPEGGETAAMPENGQRLAARAKNLGPALPSNESSLTNTPASPSPPVPSTNPCPPVNAQAHHAQWPPARTPIHLPRPAPILKQ